MVIVLSPTRIVKCLLPLKYKVAHRSCVFYEGHCSCKLSYIRETKRNSEVRFSKHEDPAGKSETVKHLIENAYYKFTCEVISTALSHYRRRKILEAFFITMRKPELNDHFEHHSMSLFRYDIT